MVNLMAASDIDREKIRLEEELRIRQQVAFATGLFQENITMRTLLESLGEGVVIIDNSGTILFLNSRAEQIFGYPTADLIGKQHSLLIPERFREIHQGHQAHFFAEPKIRPMGQLLDLAGRRMDGSEFPLEISLSYLETINGLLVLAFISDISLRKRSEKRLREVEEMFRMQVEIVKDYAIFTLDSQGIVLNWNAGAERLKGYRAEEIIGRHFSCFFPGEERDSGKPEEELKQAADEGQVTDEGWRIRKDGSRFWAEVIITALHDESGTVSGFSKVTHDITGRKLKDEEIMRLNSDLKVAIQELEVANGDLEAFNYTVAHDLRQPLNVMSMYCQSIKLLCGDQLQDECTDYLQGTHNSILRMDRLIEALLNFSRLAHVELRREKVNLSVLVHEVAEELKLAEPGRQVEFRIADSVVGTGDANLLRVVLDNLLGNAWKYTGMREKAVIEFDVTVIDHVPTYFVRDNGPGFDMTCAKKLFTPFQRLPGAEKSKGFGIGLATVERIILKHGGKVWAESEPDKGATFYFTFSAD